MKRFVLGGVVMLLGSAVPTMAATINTFDRGWYSDGGSHSPGNANYIAGTSGSTFRDFFAFNLPANPSGQHVVSATLRTATYIVGGGTQTMTLRDYAGSIANLVGGTGGVGAFNDLGNGTVYGSRLYTAADNNTFTTYALNAAALAAINASAGSAFAIGGRSSGEGIQGTYVYGFSNNGTQNDDQVQLILEYGALTSVPLPAGSFAGLVGLAGVAGLGVARRRSLNKL